MTVTIGFIVEAQSDIDVLQAIVTKCAKKSFSIRSKLTGGCGRLMGRCGAYAADLYIQGCRILIVVRDSDGEHSETLNLAIRTKLESSQFKTRLIVIAVREIEAWLLADETAIRRGLQLKNEVKATPNPESTANPKKELSRLVTLASKNTVEYVHVIHNKKIAPHLSLAKVRRCSSFKPFENFLKERLGA